MKKYGSGNRKDDRGYALLEYCAGAAIIIGVLWGALVSLGTNMSSLINNIGGWAAARAQEVSSGSGNGGSQ